MKAGSEFDTSITDFRNYLAVERSLSANSVDAYLRDIKKLAGFLERIGVDSPSKVRSADIVEYMVTQKRRKMAINSIARNIVAVKMFFRFLAGEGKIPADVSDEIDTPRLWRNLPEVLSVEEVERLLKMPDTTRGEGIRDRAILEMLYASGMRISELVALRLDRIDLDEKYVICKGKGSRERLIPIGSQAAEWTGKYIREIRERSKIRQGSEEVFLTRLGKKFTRQGMWKLLRAYLNKLNHSGDVTPHTLRHTFATHLLSNGADIRIIQAMMGHANISTTQIYTHVDINRLKSIHKRFHPRG